MEYMAKMQRGYAKHPTMDDYKIIVEDNRGAFRRRVRELRREGFRVLHAFKRGLSGVDGALAIVGGGNISWVSRYNTENVEITRAVR